MATEREARRLVDKTRNREGTFDREITEGVVADDPNMDACKIAYYPDVDLFKSPGRWLKMFLGRADPVVTNEIFPRDAVKRETLPKQDAGVPEKVLVIHENQHGEAPFAEKIGESHEQSIAELSSRAEERKRDKQLSDIEHLGEENDEKMDGDKPDHMKGGPRGEEMDELDEFRR